MNPTKPDCLLDKPEEAKSTLQESYASVFKCFEGLCSGFGTVNTGSGSPAAIPDAAPHTQGPLPSQTGVPAAASQLQSSAAAVIATPPRPVQPSRDVIGEEKVEGGYGGMIFSLQDYVTGKRKTGVEFEDSDCVIIHDAYPKVSGSVVLLCSWTIDGPAFHSPGEVPLPAHSKVVTVHAQHAK
jgi:hypothetical protein